MQDGRSGQSFGTNSDCQAAHVINAALVGLERSGKRTIASLLSTGVLLKNTVVLPDKFMIEKKDAKKENKFKSSEDKGKVIEDYMISWDLNGELSFGLESTKSLEKEIQDIPIKHMISEQGIQQVNEVEMISKTKSKTAPIEKVLTRDTFEEFSSRHSKLMNLVMFKNAINEKTAPNFAATDFDLVLCTIEAQDSGNQNLRELHLMKLNSINETRYTNEEYFSLLQLESTDSMNTWSYLKVAAFFGMPFAIIITKVDLIPEKDRSRMLKGLKKVLRTILREEPYYREPFFIEREAEAAKAAEALPMNKVCPIFLVSTESADNPGFSCLKTFLYHTKSRSAILKNELDVTAAPKVPRFEVLTSFKGRREGQPIVSGLTKNIESLSQVALGSEFLLWPFDNNRFVRVTLESLRQFNRDMESGATTSDRVSGIIKPVVKCKGGSPGIDKKYLRPGMWLIVSNSLKRPLKACRQFEADLLITYNRKLLDQIKCFGFLVLGSVVTSNIEFSVVQQTQRLKPPKRGQSTIISSFNKTEPTNQENDCGFTKCRIKLLGPLPEVVYEGQKFFFINSNKVTMIGVVTQIIDYEPGEMIEITDFTTISSNVSGTISSEKLQ